MYFYVGAICNENIKPFFLHEDAVSMEVGAGKRPGGALYVRTACLKQSFMYRVFKTRRLWWLHLHISYFPTLPNRCFVWFHHGWASSRLNKLKIQSVKVRGSWACAIVQSHFTLYLTVLSKSTGYHVFLSRSVLTQHLYITVIFIFCCSDINWVFLLNKHHKYYAEGPKGPANIFLEEALREITELVGICFGMWLIESESKSDII